MKPILFPPETTKYNNNGLGVLVDVGYCIVTEERNGSFELELQYPVNGIHYSDLAVDCQILAKPNETSDPQSFRIYNISKPMGGLVTVNAEHISYELSSVIVSPFEAENVEKALAKIKANSMSENKFMFWTDKSTVANIRHDVPRSARSLLGGVEGSLLDVYGGEYEFDNYNVKLHQNRGRDNGVTISYAKNLTGVKCEEKVEGIVTGAIAYWTRETDGIVQSIYGDLQTVNTELSYSKNVIVDCSSEFEDAPSKLSLNEYALKYIQSHKNAPYFSVSVEFVNLGDTEEYKQYKGLYRVNLCDTVTVRHPVYGIDVKAKVVKTVFDSVTEKYDKIQIGEIASNISQTIATQEKEIAQKVTQSVLDKAIANATSAITGNKGGYVVLNPPNNPQELLIIDKPNLNEAVNVWRWNLSGLGHSGNGYNGKFTTAITADGQIVADFITTGTLNANNIDIINMTADNITSGVLQSSNGLSYFSLNTGNARFGGENYYTDISQGVIKQYLASAGGNVGGIAPAGSEEGICETIYYDSTNENSKGVAISYENEYGYFPTIAVFKKETIDFYNSVYFYNPVYLNDIKSDYFIGINAPNIGIGGSTILDGFKLSVVGNMHVGGKVYSTGEISGAAITNRSDRAIKKDIQKTKTKNALQSIKDLSIYDYLLKNNGESVKMGLMADEAPKEILSENGDGINLYSYCGLLALAVQELSKDLENLKNGVIS